MTEQSHYADRAETPAREPDGCAVTDVVAIVMRLLIERGHLLAEDAAHMASARSAAAGLLLAFGIRPIVDGRFIVGPPYYGLGSGPFHLEGDLRR